ncbi:MAG: DUF2341 domain-containing protein, partial [Bacteroidales bacterium]
MYHSIKNKRPNRNCNTCLSPFRGSRGSWKSLSPGRLHFPFPILVFIFFFLIPFVGYGQTADFFSDKSEVCVGGTVTYTDNSSGATTWEWDFGEGAIPETISGVGPHAVTYTSGGSKTVSLTINGSVSPVTKSESDFITVNPLPDVSFGYKYQRSITIDQINVDEDLIDFPLLVNIPFDNLLEHSDHGGNIEHPNGFDLIFTDKDYNRLDHELQEYDEATGQLIAWVRIPLLSHDENTELYMLYGNPAISSDPSTPETWNSNYAGVWHFSGEAGNAFNDATINGNNGNNFGSTEAPGKIGKGREFNENYIQIPNNSSLALTNNQVTLQAWVLRPADALQDGPFIVKGNEMNEERYMLGIQNSSNRINTRVTTSSGHFRDDSDEVIPENIWTHLTFVYDGTLSTNPRKLVYMNGVLEDEHSADGIITSALTDQIHFGKRLGTDDRFFRGSLDEIRISKTTRSPAWIKTEYLNQNNPGTFLTYSPETVTGNLTSIGACEGRLLLNFGYPSGGVYSGTGVAPDGGSYYFDPVDVPGNYDITYTYTDALACQGVITKTITVIADPLAPDVAVDYIVTCASNVANLEASGTNLKWYSDAGLTTPVHTGTPFMTGITSPGTYTYYVTQTINGCESPAQVVTLEVIEPEITVPPANLTVCAGQDASFSVTATHASTYQWQLNGVNLIDKVGHVSGSETNSLQLTNVSLHDAGEYRCLVTDVCGREAMVSDAAVLTVNPAPAVTFGYDFEKTITINHTMVSGTDNLIDFPVLIDIIDDDLRFTPSGNVKNEKGYDIVFSADNEILDHELEFYESSTGKYTAWVRIPVLSASENTIIKIHYGNSLISTDPSSPNTWSSDYVGVWHMNNGNYRDATGNWNDGNAFGIDPIAAVIAEGGDFRKTGSIDDRIEIGNVDLTGDKLTLSAWINIRDFTTHDARIISKASSTDPDDHLWMLSTFNDGTDQKIRFRIKTSGSPNTEELLSTTTLSAGIPRFVSGVYDGTDMRIYINGGSSDNDKLKTGDISSDPDIHAAIGNQPKLAWVLGNNSKRAFNGTLDEVRVIKAARSADWLATEYNNQSSPSTFYTTGPEVSNPSHDFTVCLNETVVYNTAAVPGATYLWEVNRGTITSGGSTPSAQVNWNNNGTGSTLLRLTVTLGTCTSVVEPTVTFHPFVVADIDGSALVCPESTGIPYEVDATAGSTYAWVVEEGTVASGGGTSEITVNWGSTNTNPSVRITKTNAQGCSVTNTLPVAVEDTEVPIIDCPVGDQTFNTDPGTCYYTHSGTAWNASATDNCSAPSIGFVLTGATELTGTSLDGVVFLQGSTLVTWTATDGAGNTASCFYTVTVTDNQDPTVTAAADVVSTTSADGTGDCTVVLAITDATFGDNCSSNLSWEMTGAVLANGTGQVGTYTFPIGVTTITYTNTDGAGLTATDAMTVTVTDDENPVITCTVTDLTVDADNGVCTYTHSGTAWD